MKRCKGCGSSVRDEQPKCWLCGSDIFENECIPVFPSQKPAPGGASPVSMDNLFPVTGAVKPAVPSGALPRMGGAGPVSMEALFEQTGAARPVGMDDLFAQMDDNPNAAALHFAASPSMGGGLCVVGADAALPPELEIPTQHNGMPVTEIAFRAFEQRDIISVHIPETVQYIGERAFENCRGLTRVTGCAGLTMIGQRAFAGCLHLTRLDLPEHRPGAFADSFAGCFDSGMAFEDRVTIDEGV